MRGLLLSRESLAVFRSYIVPVIVALLFSSFVGLFFYLFGRQRIVVFSPNVGSDLISNLLFSFVVVGIGLCCSVLLYYVSTRGKGAAANVIAALTLIPFLIVFIVFFGETLVLALFHQTSGPIEAFLEMGSIYLSVFSVMILMTQSSTSATKNIVFILYGGIIGGFAGLIVPEIPLIVMLTVISFFDWAMLRKSRLAIIIKQEKFRKGNLKLYYESEDIEMGIGEFITYSMLPANALFYFDPLTYFTVMTLLFVGCVVNFAVLSRTRLLAGIPIPILLTLSFLMFRVLASIP
jgi:hypothetical protein